jgi:N-acetylmuramoyl-L-alanine amidase
MRAVPAGLLAALLLLAPAAAAAPVAVPELVAVVDPGHGGDKEGAVGPGGLREKDLSLAIARRIAARLREGGARVLLTRERDEGLDLSLRAALANAAEADLFVSVHLNSMATADGRARTRGIETYFLSPDATDARAVAVAARENADRAPAEVFPTDDAVAGILADLSNVEALAESSRLAHAVHERLVLRTGAEDHGVKQAPFHVLAGARMPAVLVEVGFISHRDEARQLADPAYQERIAAAVAEGIAAFRAGARRAAR